MEKIVLVLIIGLVTFESAFASLNDPCPSYVSSDIFTVANICGKWPNSINCDAANLDFSERDSGYRCSYTDYSGNLFIADHGLIRLISTGRPAVAKTAKKPQPEIKVTFLDVAKKPNGDVNYMKYDEAIQFCANIGARLPSARELVQLLVSRGARGIVDSCSPKERTFKYECDQELVVNADRTNDSFYYSSFGYKLPDGEQLSVSAKENLWSSSVDQKLTDFAYTLNSYFGYLLPSSRTNPNVRESVRCVINQ